MNDAAGTIVLRGYIEHQGDWWQAICIDLDIAAQGRTLAEAKALLDDMVATYLAALRDCTPADRRRLLRRKSPVLVRLGFFWRFALATLFATRRGHDTVSFISHSPCPT